MFFIGQTRFSLANPGSAAWVLSKRLEIEEYLSRLYDPQRLDARIEIFKNKSIPQIEAAAMGFDVKHIVSYSDTLPEKYQDTLEDLQDQYSFLVLDKQSDYQDPLNIAQLALGMSQGYETEFGFYRLDDDDVLPASYFERMSVYLKKEFRGFAVSLARGYTAMYSNGSLANIREVHHPMIAIGIMTVSWVDSFSDVHHVSTGAHITADRRMPVILDSRQPGFVWMRHVEQDSASRIGADQREKSLIHNMSKYPEIQSHQEFNREFPKLLASMPWASEASSTDDAHSLPFEWTCTEDASTYFIRCTIDGFLDVKGRNGICCLNLVDVRSGQRLKGVVIDGLAESENPSIGYFYYLPSGSEVEKVLHLPAGVRLESVSIKAWLDPSVETVQFNIHWS